MENEPISKKVEGSFNLLKLQNVLQSILHPVEGDMV